MHGADSIRTFIAVPIPPPIQDELDETCRQMKRQLAFRKWVHPRDYHITVQFLGETNRSATLPLISALSSAVKDFSPFPLQVGDWGWFGRKQRPSILWRGVHDPEGILPNLASQVRKVTAQFGFEDDGKPFKAHITVARQFTGELFPVHLLADQSAETSDEDIPKNKPPLTWEAHAIILYESRLGQKPMYSPIHTVEWPT